MSSFCKGAGGNPVQSLVLPSTWQEQKGHWQKCQKELENFKLTRGEYLFARKVLRFALLASERASDVRKEFFDYSETHIAQHGDTEAHSPIFS